jgi:hypothetical protein
VDTIISTYQQEALSLTPLFGEETISRYLRVIRTSLGYNTSLQGYGARDLYWLILDFTKLSELITKIIQHHTTKPTASLPHALWLRASFVMLLLQLFNVPSVLWHFSEDNDPDSANLCLSWALPTTRERQWTVPHLLQGLQHLSNACCLRQFHFSTCRPLDADTETTLVHEALNDLAAKVLLFCSQHAAAVEAAVASSGGTLHTLALWEQQDRPDTLIPCTIANGFTWWDKILAMEATDYRLWWDQELSNFHAALHGSTNFISTSYSVLNDPNEYGDNGAHNDDGSELFSQYSTQDSDSDVAKPVLSIKPAARNSFAKPLANPLRRFGCELCSATLKTRKQLIVHIRDVHNSTFDP